MTHKEQNFSSFVIFLSLQLSDWDRYAAQEYELLVAEESAAETAG